MESTFQVFSKPESSENKPNICFRPPTNKSENAKEVAAATDDEAVYNHVYPPSVPGAQGVTKFQFEPLSAVRSTLSISKRVSNIYGSLSRGGTPASDRYPEANIATENQTAAPRSIDGNSDSDWDECVDFLVESREDNGTSDGEESRASGSTTQYSALRPMALYRTALLGQAGQRQSTLRKSFLWGDESFSDVATIADIDDSEYNADMEDELDEEDEEEFVNSMEYSFSEGHDSDASQGQIFDYYVESESAPQWIFPDVQPTNERTQSE